MGWSIGYDSKHGGRHIGYGVPAFCDHPGCGKYINRGLSHVCAKEEPYGGELGCGLYFCADHLTYHEGKDDDSSGFMCERCDEFHTRMAKRGSKNSKFDPFQPAPEHPDWTRHVLKDKTWKKWREENPEKVKRMKEIVGEV